MRRVYSYLSSMLQKGRKKNRLMYPAVPLTRTTIPYCDTVIATVSVLFPLAL